MIVNVNLIVENVIQTEIRMKNCVDVSVKILQNILSVKIQNSATCSCDIDLKSIIGDSVVTYDEILDVIAKSYKKPRNFNEKRLTCKIQNLYILISFSLIIMLLLIIVRIYNCHYQIKHLSKQKHICHITIVIINQKEIDITYVILK